MAIEIINLQVKLSQWLTPSGDQVGCPSYNFLLACYLKTSTKTPLRNEANIESSPVWDNSCLDELIYDLIVRQFLCGKCPKTVTIQYLHTGEIYCRLRAVLHLSLYGNSWQKWFGVCVMLCMLLRMLISP